MTTQRRPSCPQCGTPLPFQTLKGTTIQVTGDCPKDSCPNPEWAPVRGGIFELPTGTGICAEHGRR